MLQRPMFLRPALYACLLAAAMPVAAQTARQPSDPAAPLTGLLSDARARGCGGRAGVQAPLRHSAALDQAAARMAQGEAAAEATRTAHYRSIRLFQVSMSGYASPAAVAKAMADQFCAALMDPSLADVGVHQQGRSYRILLAARLEPPGPNEAAGVAARILALTNQARAQPRRCGNDLFEAAPPLQLEPLLERAAALHARDMAQHSYLEHEGRDGSTPAQRIERAGYRWRSVGENIASGQPTAEAAMREWLQSPPHCATLMRPGYTQMGVAFAFDPNSAGGIYWAQEFARPR